MSREVLADAFEDLARRAPRVDAGAFAESAVHGARRARGRALLAGPALAVVLLLALFSAVTVLPRPAPAPGPAEPAPAAVLPARVVAYPPWTPLLGEGEPLGRAAYVLEQAEGYFVVGVDGSARRLPSPPAGLGLTSPVLSPDGKVLAYAWSAPTEIPDLSVEQAARSALFVVDLTTGRTREVAWVKAGRAVRYPSLAWSPDGNRLAVVTTEGRHRGDTNWGSTRRLTMLQGSRRLWSASADVSTAVAWSPDGTRLATWQFGGRFVGLWRARDGERQGELKVPLESDLDAAAWSPEGRSLNLLRRVGSWEDTDPPMSRWALVEVDVDGKGLRQRGVGHAINPWLVGWREGRPVLELPDSKGVPQLVAVTPRGSEHLIALEGKVGGTEPAVAAHLLSSAPIRKVDARTIPLWSARGLTWVAQRFAAPIAVGAVAFAGTFALGRKIGKPQRRAH